MAQESSQRKLSTSAEFWWVAILSLVLFVLNAVVVVVGGMLLPFADYFELKFGLNLDFLQSVGGRTAFYSLYLLLFFSMFFLMGLLYGCITGKARSVLYDTTFVSLNDTTFVSLIGSFLGFCVLSFVLKELISGEMGLSLSLIFASSLLLVGLQVGVAAVVGILGGLIGSRLLRSPFVPGVQPLADTVVDDDQ